MRLAIGNLLNALLQGLELFVATLLIKLLLLLEFGVAPGAPDRCGAVALS
ncbi:hypothetical protein N9C85_01225 [Synechococcus sp. AH-224-I15]|nr:hypothetical protein [Synechococcus sp. AH-224-I15]